MLKITILSDNRPAESEDGSCHVETEHGLSLLIETSSHSILCDMGASDLFSRNADALGIDLNKVDFGFISHAHYDHTGGLSHFLCNFHQPVYLSEKVFVTKCSSSRKGPEKDISADHSLAEPFSGRYRYIHETESIAPDIFAVVPKNHGYPTPAGNRWLTDDFSHEIALAIKTGNGLVIVSSCSHHGAVNIIESCCGATGESRVTAFIGGLHFTDGPEAGSEVDEFCSLMKIRHPETVVFTGHCTGQDAYAHFINSGYDKVHFFHTGKVMTIN